MFGPYKRLLKANTGRPDFRTVMMEGDSILKVNPAMARLAWITEEGSTKDSQIAYSSKIGYWIFWIKFGQIGYSSKIPLALGLKILIE